jgi:adenylate cyclase class IV
MAMNIEIKARAPDPARLDEAARRIAGPPAAVLEQEDTFFDVRQGRLKLRAFGAAGKSPRPGELIFYERPDALGPKACQYAIARVEDAEPLRAILAAALGTAGVVRKRRTLHLVGRTRIHLDDVEGLGRFVELETVMGPGEAREAGVRATQAIMDALGIAMADLIDRAYVDLLSETRGDGALRGGLPPGAARSQQEAGG